MSGDSSPASTAEPTRAAGRRALDPDALAVLEEERDFLLRSLDDLEAEFAAGDIDEADYEQLHSDYTARAADAIRSIEQRRTAMEAAAPTRSARQKLGWVAGLLVFAVGAGWLLAQAVGERGVTGQITGSIDLSPREQFFECQFLDQSGRVEEALECYTGVLDQEPDNVETLAYRGWLLVRVSTELDNAGRAAESDELLATGKNAIAQAVALDPTYPDARAFQIIVANGEGDTERACREFAAFQELTPPPFMVELVQGNMAGTTCI